MAFVRLEILLAVIVGWPAASLAQQVEGEPRLQSGADERREVSITVYNQNFGLVREVRQILLGSGRVTLEYKDVAAQIQPETVHIKSLNGDGSLRVLEQNYQYDLLSPQNLTGPFTATTAAAPFWIILESRPWSALESTVKTLPSPRRAVCWGTREKPRRPPLPTLFHCVFLSQGAT